jgi:hypothetical protein
MRVLKVKTSRINHPPSEDELVLNTTIGSGTGMGGVFAPTWDLVKASKAGKISWEQYTDAYYRLMRNRFLDNNEAFEQVLSSNKTIVFCCYCNDAEKTYTQHHCHRFLLVDIFRKLAESRGITFEYVGEFGKR